MSLYNDIKKGIPQTIEVPKELEAVVNWYENSDELMGGLFEFYADEDLIMVENWFGKNTHKDRFGSFGIMPDGSPIAFWLNNEGEQKVVMLGSEGDGQMILANNFIDFIRLMSIGYDEFMYIDFNQTIEEHNKENEQEENYGVNKEFQNWFQNKFEIRIPLKGNEIVNEDNDIFANWVNEQLEG